MIVHFIVKTPVHHWILVHSQCWMIPLPDSKIESQQDRIKIHPAFLIFLIKHWFLSVCKNSISRLYPIYHKHCENTPYKPKSPPKCERPHCEAFEWAWLSFSKDWPLAENAACTHASSPSSTLTTLHGSFIGEHKKCIGCHCLAFALAHVLTEIGFYWTAWPPSRRKINSEVSFLCWCLIELLYGRTYTVWSDIRDSMPQCLVCIQAILR